jgi:hypothetical protein
MQDPKIAQIMGQNPQAQAIQGAAMAHVMEHVAFQYRREIEKMLGAALPPMPEQAEGDEEAEHILPPEFEVQLSQLSAQAASKLLQKDQAEAAMMAAQQAAQDPVMQLQMRDVAVKEAEVERKKAKDLMDAAAKNDAMALKEKETTSRSQLDMLRMLIEASKNQDTLDQNQQMELLRLVTDMAKEQDRIQSQETQARERTGADMQKHGSSLADKAEDRKSKAEQAKQKPKAKKAEK